MLQNGGLKVKKKKKRKKKSVRDDMRKQTTN